MVNIVLASNHAIVCNSSPRKGEFDGDMEDTRDTYPVVRRSSQDTMPGVQRGSHDAIPGVRRRSQDTIPGVCRNLRDTGVRRSSQEAACDVPGNLLMIAPSQHCQNAVSSASLDSNTSRCVPDSLSVDVSELQVDVAGQKLVPLSSTNSPLLQHNSPHFLRSQHNSIELCSPAAKSLAVSDGTVTVSPRRHSVRQHQSADQNKSPSDGSSSGNVGTTMPVDKAVDGSGVSVACTDCHIILTSATEAAAHRCRKPTLLPCVNSGSSSSSSEMIREFVQVDNRLKRLLGISTEVLYRNTDSDVYRIDPVHSRREYTIEHSRLPSISAAAAESVVTFASSVSQTSRVASSSSEQAAITSSMSAVSVVKNISTSSPTFSNVLVASLSSISNPVPCISSNTTAQAPHISNVQPLTNDSLTSAQAVNTSSASALSTSCTQSLAGNSSTLSVSVQSLNTQSTEAVSMYSTPTASAGASSLSSRLWSSMSPVVLPTSLETRVPTAGDESPMRCRAASLGHGDLKQTSPGAPCIDLPVLEMHKDNTLGALRVCCDTELNTSDDMEMPLLTAAFTPQ